MTTLYQGAEVVTDSLYDLHDNKKLAGQAELFCNACRWVCLCCRTNDQ